ncbi:MAG: hypothetical protein CL908_07960 [Deltaproteobacteria bacterium]|nr:hypothetical protein [Deltaproteobacteria bacterium]
MAASVDVRNTGRSSRISRTPIQTLAVELNHSGSAYPKGIRGSAHEVDRRGDRQSEEGIMRCEWLPVVCALLAVALACVSPDFEARVEALERDADRRAVTGLIQAYAHGIDGMDEVLLRRTFAADAVAEYVGVNFPMDDRLEGIDAILGWLRLHIGDREGALPWHYMSTHLVEVEGDRATLRSFQHNRHMSGVGLYTVEARRTIDGWRIQKLRLEERILSEELLERLGADSPPGR